MSKKYGARKKKNSLKKREGKKNEKRWKNERMKKVENLYTCAKKGLRKSLKQNKEKVADEERRNKNEKR